MKHYLVNRNGNWIVEGRTSAPHDAEYCDAPYDDEGRATNNFDFVQVEDESGETRTKAVFNKEKKDLQLLKDAETKLAQENFLPIESLVKALWQMVVEKNDTLVKQMQDKIIKDGGKK